MWLLNAMERRLEYRSLLTNTVCFLRRRFLHHSRSRKFVKKVGLLLAPVLEADLVLLEAEEADLVLLEAL